MARMHFGSVAMQTAMRATTRTLSSEAKARKTPSSTFTQIVSYDESDPEAEVWLEGESSLVWMKRPLICASLRSV